MKTQMQSFSHQQINQGDLAESSDVIVRREEIELRLSPCQGKKNTRIVQSNHWDSRAQQQEDNKRRVLYLSQPHGTSVPTRDELDELIVSFLFHPRLG